jgi:hypothetical protein
VSSNLPRPSEPIGVALDRGLASLAHGEAVASAIDHFIEVRDRERRKAESDRREAEAWKESTRVYNEKQRVQARYEWHLHHTAQAERLRRTLEDLIAHHELEAARLGG